MLSMCQSHSVWALMTLPSQQVEAKRVPSFLIMLDCALDGAPVVQQWELDRPFTNARDRNDSKKYRQGRKTDTRPI